MASIPPPERVIDSTAVPRRWLTPSVVGFGAFGFPGLAAMATPSLPLLAVLFTTAGLTLAFALAPHVRGEPRSGGQQ